MPHPFSFSFFSSSSSPSPPPHGPAVNGSGGRWGPYSSSKNFDVNMATILIILVLATVLAFALHSALRFLLRLYRRSHHHLPTSADGLHPSKQSHKNSTSSLADALPTLVFSPGTRLAGGADHAAECSICLSEFVFGERVLVLPACNHGFHMKCVERWLVSTSSCPTCRTSCLLAPPSSSSSEP